MYPSPCLSSNNNQTKECWYNWVLTGGKLPAPVTDWQSVTRWIKYKDQLLSIFQHSLEEIVHICPVIRHERTWTLFYSSWIFSYILFVSQRRKVLIDSAPVSLCKVSKDNSISRLIVLYLFCVIISLNHSIIQSATKLVGGGEEGRIIEWKSLSSAEIIERLLELCV